MTDDAAHFEIDRRLLARVRGRIDKKSFFVNGELDPVIRRCSNMLRLAAQSVKTTDQARALEVVQTGFVRAFRLAEPPNSSQLEEGLEYLGKCILALPHLPLDFQTQIHYFCNYVSSVK